MVKHRASKHYKHFVDTFIFYQALFEGSGDLNSILNLPYPLYKDIIIKQVEEKKREKKVFDQKAKNQTKTLPTRKGPIK